jgi:hypothetical protein
VAPDCAAVKGVPGRTDTALWAAGMLNTTLEDQVFQAPPPRGHFIPETTDEYFFQDEAKEGFSVPSEDAGLIGRNTVLAAQPTRITGGPADKDYWRPSRQGF